MEARARPRPQGRSGVLPQREGEAPGLADPGRGEDPYHDGTVPVRPDAKPVGLRLARPVPGLTHARNVRGEAGTRTRCLAGREGDERRRSHPGPLRMRRRGQRPSLRVEQGDVRLAADPAGLGRAIDDPQAVHDVPRAGAPGDDREAAAERGAVARRAERERYYDRRDQKSWFSPAKIADTESSEKTLWIVSARIPETESTSTFSGLVSGLIGTVSVTITRSKTLSRIRSSASPLKSACVAHAITRVAPAAFSACAPAQSVPAVSMMSSVITAV